MNLNEGSIVRARVDVDVLHSHSFLDISVDLSLLSVQNF